MRSFLLLGFCGAYVLAGCGGKIAPGSSTTSTSGSPGATATGGLDAGTVVGVVDASRSVVDASVVPIDAPVSSVDATSVGIDASESFDSGTVSFDGSEPEAGEGDAGCAMISPFMAVTWAPPTPLHQGACTAAQTSTYTNSLENGSNIPTSGNTKCDACLSTDQSAPAHGPIVSISMGGMEVPVELNSGGCLAHFDGMTTAMSCGATYNDLSDCVNQECGACEQNPNQMSGLQACEDQVVAAGQPCEAFNLSSACNAEVNEMGGDGGAAQCINISSLEDFFNLWCGT